MKKKTNYFSHDSNARNDEKMLAVRIKYGAEGYGIYFMILERLREEAKYSCVKDYSLLAFDLRVDASKLKSIVEDFGLFAFTEDGKCFYSESFNLRMVLKDEKSGKAKELAIKRWGKKEETKRASGCLFYVIEVFNSTETFLKCGITSESVSRRFSGKLNGYNYRLISQIDVGTTEALQCEKYVCENCERYEPLIKFPGYLECYNHKSLNMLRDFVMQKENIRNATKESKVKESKVNIEADFPPPKKTMEEKQEAFRIELVPFVETYGKDMIRAFFDYWREPNKSKTKMRWEQEPTWDLSLRLKKWESNNYKFKNGNEKPVIKQPEVTYKQI